MKMPRLVIHEQLVKQLIKGNAEARPFSEFDGGVPVEWAAAHTCVPGVGAVCSMARVPAPCGCAGPWRSW